MSQAHTVGSNLPEGDSPPQQRWSPAAAASKCTVSPTLNSVSMDPTCNVAGAVSSTTMESPYMGGAASRPSQSTLDTTMSTRSSDVTPYLPLSRVLNSDGSIKVGLIRTEPSVAPRLINSGVEPASEASPPEHQMAFPAKSTEAVEGVPLSPTQECESDRDTAVHPASPLGSQHDNFAAAAAASSFGQFTIPPTARAPVKVRNVYVAGLPLSYTEHQLLNLLKPFGNVLSCRMFSSGETVVVTGKAYGFGLFERPEEAIAAVQRLSVTVIDQTCLFAQVSRVATIRRPRESAVPPQHPSDHQHQLPTQQQYQQPQQQAFAGFHAPQPPYILQPQQVENVNSAQYVAVMPPGLQQSSSSVPMVLYALPAGGYAMVPALHQDQPFNAQSSSGVTSNSPAMSWQPAPTFGSNSFVPFVPQPSQGPQSNQSNLGAVMMPSMGVSQVDMAYQTPARPAPLFTRVSVGNRAQQHAPPPDSNNTTTHHPRSAPPIAHWPVSQPTTGDYASFAPPSTMQFYQPQQHQQQQPQQQQPASRYHTLAAQPGTAANHPPNLLSSSSPPQHQHHQYIHR